MLLLMSFLMSLQVQFGGGGVGGPQPLNGDEPAGTMHTAAGPVIAKTTS
jgi:hypothetical protein